jgi:hypothetical protein
MIVGGALRLDREANSHLHRLAALPVEQLFLAFMDEVCRFSWRTGRQLNASTPPLINSGFSIALIVTPEGLPTPSLR